MGRKCLILVSAMIFLLHFVSATIPERSGPDNSKHFVLVHGGCHGAWSWYKLMALLKSSGHNVTTLDMASAGINPKQVSDVPSIIDYFMPLMEFMASLPPDAKVILVAHSHGGLGVSQVMERFLKKISVAVFVTARMPGPDLNISAVYQESSRRQGSQLDNRFIYDNGLNSSPTAFVFGPQYLAAKLYQLSTSEDLALATTLIRPLSLYNAEKMSRELIFSTKNYGSVRRVFIIAEQDKLFEKDYQEWMIERNTPDEVEEIRGADHMVMMSRPVELYLALQRISKKYS